MEATKQPSVQARPRVKSVVNGTIHRYVTKPEVALTANVSTQGVFPVVLVKVDGITMRPLVDSGSNSSYVLAKVLRYDEKETERKYDQVCGNVNGVCTQLN